jgi:hypothetical protein
MPIDIARYSIELFKPGGEGADISAHSRQPRAAAFGHYTAAGLAFRTRASTADPCSAQSWATAAIKSSPSLFRDRRRGDWHRAAIEFRRAEAVPGSVNERWREVGQTAEGRDYIDMKTFDDARRDSVRFWIKQRGENESDGAYTLLHFELNCTAERLRTLSIAKYGLAGELLANREGGKWETIVPDTVGESLHDGACR